MSFENLPPNFDVSQDGTHAVFNLPIVKSTKDDRSYKLIRLPNQLNPETDKAGASLEFFIIKRKLWLRNLMPRLFTK